MKRVSIGLLAGVVGILLLWWMFDIKRQQNTIRATSTWSYMDGVARTIKLYFEIHTQLPERLSQAVEGPASLDFSGKPIEYRIIEKQTFELRATGTNGVLTKLYSVSGTNLIIHEHK